MAIQFDDAPYTQLTTPARGDVQGVIKDVSEALPENQTKFATQEDLHQFGSWASKVRAVTASGSVTLANTDPMFIEIDPDGANRDVNFPAKSDDNHAYLVLHSGSANTLTLKRSGGATITTLAAGEAKYIMPSTLEDFNALAGGSSSGGTGSLTVSVASVTTSNVTGVEDTHHILDISGLTANRDFNLPTPTAAGKRVRVTISTGDAVYVLIVKVNSSEVTRLFITNETLEFVSTGTGAGNWQLSDDGRINSIGIMERRTSQTINNTTDTKVQLSTKVKDVGDICDNTTNYRITVRRAGSYDITAYLALDAQLDDQEVVAVYLYINGTLDRIQQTFISFGTANRTGVTLLNIKKELVAGDYIEMNAYHTEGAAVNTNTLYYPQLAVVELGTGAGSASSGGSALSDGDYGDITVGSSGTTMTIDAGAVTLAKLVDATAQYKLLGRLSSGAGDFEEITGSANVFSFLQAADYAAMLTLLFGVALPENTAIQLDAALSADGKYSGIVLPSQTAGATLAFGDLCYLQTSDSRWELVDADAESTCSNMLGMCVLAAAADGSATTILVFGKIRADANFPVLTIGAPVYASTTAGDVQTTAPSGTLDIVRKVGHALTADELFFNPSNDYYEIA